MIPRGLDVIDDLLTDVVIEPIMFQPVKTFIVANVISSPRIAARSFAGYLSQYACPGMRSGCMTYPRLESYAVAAEFAPGNKESFCENSGITGTETMFHGV